jgi:hypothetical protein
MEEDGTMRIVLVLAFLTLSIQFSSAAISVKPECTLEGDYFSLSVEMKGIWKKSTSANEVFHSHIAAFCRIETGRCSFWRSTDLGKPLSLSNPARENPNVSIAKVKDEIVLSDGSFRRLVIDKEFNSVRYQALNSSGSLEMEASGSCK